MHVDVAARSYRKWLTAKREPMNRTFPSVKKCREAAPRLKLHHVRKRAEKKDLKLEGGAISDVILLFKVVDGVR
jgi:hypothetical protein